MTQPAAKFRKLPVVVEAMPWDGTEDSAREIMAWMNGHAMNRRWSPSYRPGINCIFIPTLEGTMQANPGDWIIKGVNGEFYPCKPDIFNKTYEPEENE